MNQYILIQSRIREGFISMPHVTDEIAEEVKKRGYATNSGEFAAQVAMLAVEYLSYNGWGFKQRAEVLSGLTSTLDEWRKYLSKYEDVKAEQNGNIFEKTENKLRKK